MVDEVEERRLRPVEVVEDANQGGRLLEEPPERPGDLVCDRRLVRLAEERRDRRGRARI